MKNTETTVCESCRSPKATLRCGLCEADQCRSCAQFLDEERMPLQPELPDELKHSYYCQHCHDQTVAPALEQYDQFVEQAKEVYISSINSRVPLPILKKAKERMFVKDCLDKKEVEMRLAFQAVSQGFNAVIEVETEDKKVRNEGWQKKASSGSGMAALVDVEKMESRYGKMGKYGRR